MSTPTEDQPVPIMVRALLTPTQFHQLRVAAVEKKTTVQQLIGALIVVYLQEREEFS